MLRTARTTEADLARALARELEERLASHSYLSLDHESRDGRQPERLETGYEWDRGVHD